jgi:hypothetical protein
VSIVVLSEVSVEDVAIVVGGGSVVKGLGEDIVGEELAGFFEVSFALCFM